MAPRRTCGAVLLGLALSLPVVASEAGANLSPERRARMDELLEKRVVLLSGTLDDEAAEIAIAQLLFLESKGSGEIALVIDSDGGRLTNGVAIRDTMIRLGAPVATYCAARCAGPAVLVLSAGAKGRRHASASARVELRDVSPADVPAEKIPAARLLVAAVLSSSTGGSPEAIRRDLAAGVVLDAEKARRYGLVEFVGPPPPSP